MVPQDAYMNIIATQQTRGISKEIQIHQVAMVHHHLKRVIGENWLNVLYNLNSHKRHDDSQDSVISCHKRDQKTEELDTPNLLDFLA